MQNLFDSELRITGGSGCPSREVSEVTRMANKIRRIIDFDPETLKELDQKRRELSVERGKDISRNQAVDEAIRFWLKYLEEDK